MTTASENRLAGLIAKIDSREARIGIIGMGYVGLPLALLFSGQRFRVTGFDIEQSKVDKLNAGKSYIVRILPSEIQEAQRAGFSATADYSELAQMDAVIICVPTPLNGHHEPDLSFVTGTVQSIAPWLREGQLIVLESTTYPGTTEEIVVPLLEAGNPRGLKVSRTLDESGVHVAFSPEREDPGNERYTTKNIPKVVGGVDDASRDLAVALYTGALDRVVPVSSAEVAEAAKLLENIFRSVNIALVNEMKVLLDRMGIDVWEVIEAAKTKPFGFMPFYPGPGLGGHCIPLDPFYLSWKAAEYGVWARFIELAGEINTAMPRYVVDRTVEALNAQGRSVKGARILVLGLSYKADIDDDRESPSFEILEAFREKGAVIAYCDPYVPVARRGRHHDLGLASVPCTAEEFARHDAVVISTAHRDFRDLALYEKARLVVDTRNVVPPSTLPPGTVVRA
jgi:UDP-N-acetyl-D-glucosamine dehydrogenase